MKTKRNSVIALALVAALTGCSREEEAATKTREQVMLSAGVETGVAEANSRAATRAATVTAFTNKAFTMIVKDRRAGASVTPFTPIVGQAKTGTGLTGKPIDVTTNAATTTGGVDPAAISFAPTLYWDDLGGREAELQFFGVYPENAAITPVNNTSIFWEVPTTQTEETETTKDLLLAYRAEYTWQKDRGVAANLNFKHVLAKITFVVKKGATFGTTAFNPTIQIEKNLPIKGTVGLEPDAKGAYTFTTGGSAPITPFKSKVATDGSYTFTALFLPGATLTPDDKFATITVGANRYHISPSGKTPVTLNAGENTVFSVTVNKSEITTSATVTGWTDVSLPDIDRQLIEPTVGEITGTDIKEGSMLYLTFTDTDPNTEDKSVNYIATKVVTEGITKLQWNMTGTPLYWDDIAIQNSVSHLKVKAILNINDGGLNKKENLYEKEQEVITMYSLTFFNMTHVMSKVMIYIRTTPATDGKAVIYPTKPEDSVVLPSFKDCTINGSTVTDITNPATADISTVKSASSTDDKGIAWDLYTAYIKPQIIAEKEKIINIKIAGNSYPIVAGTGGKEFKKAESNTYHITITKSGINASATIKEWENVDNGSLESGIDGSKP